MRKLFSLITAVLFAGSMMADVTVTKSVNDLFPNDANGTQEPTLYSDANLSISVNADGNNGKVYGSGTEWRLYQTNSPIVTVAATNATIKTVAFEFTVKNTGALKFNDAAMTSNVAVTVNAESAQFIVGNSGAATNGQVIIKGFTIVYDGEGGGDQPGGDTTVVPVDTTEIVPLADPTNCAEAREAAMSVSANNELYNGGKEYTINGYVTSIAYAWKSGNMSFWMADAADGGNVLEAYKCAIENEADAVLVGDKVAVTGKLTKYNTTPEFAQGCTVQILERAQQDTTVTPVDTIPVVPEDTTVVPVEGGTEVIFTNADFAGQGTATTGSQVTATKDGVTFTCSKGYSADESLRCYAHGTLSITASSIINKINFTTTGGKTGGLDAEVEVNATSYEVADLASQARFTEIKVTLGEGGDTTVVPVDTTEIPVDTTVVPVDTLSCAAAAELALSGNTDERIIKGYVTDIVSAWQEQYKNVSFWMADAVDGGKVFEAFRVACATAEEAPGAGDLVWVKGNLKNYNGTPETNAGGTFGILVKAEVVPVDTTEIPVDTTVVPVEGGTEVIFTNADFAGQGTANTGSEVTATKDGVTFTYSKGYSAEESLRCYAHGTLSITASSIINKINFTTTGGKTGGLDAEVEVNATSYEVADLASQARFTEIKVTLGEGGDTTVVPVDTTEIPVDTTVVPVDTLSCAAAAELALSGNTDERIIKGYVTDIVSAWQEQYKNVSFWMADAVDGGKVFEAYRVACATAEEAPGAGDLVWVKGNLKNYNGTPETNAGGTFGILVKAEVVPVDTTEIPVDTTDVPVVEGVIILPSDFTPVTTSDYSVTKEGVTVAVTASTVTAEQMRIFKGKTITISSAANITGIEFTCTANGTAQYGPGCFAAQDGYSYETDGKIGTWVGSAKSVTFTAETSQVRLTQIVVALDGDTTIVPVDTYTVAGAPDSIFGSLWDPTDTNNDMVLKDGLYTWEKTLYLSAGTQIEFKVVKNHSWNVASYPADNVIATVDEDGEYVFPIAFQPENQQVFAALHKVEPLADPTNCAEAAAAALSVSANNELYNNGATYTIEGYVTGIKTAYSEQYHNISFWMADTKDGGEVLQAYRAVCASEADAPAVGDKVAVTGQLTKYNTTPEFAAGCTYVITEKTTVLPVNLGEKTIADFLALKNDFDTCILTGVVDSIVNTTYGNLYISDATAQVYVYGVLTADGQSKKFAELGVEAGDILTIKAIYNEFNNTPQVKNAIFVSVTKTAAVMVHMSGEDVTYQDNVADEGWWQIVAQNDDYYITLSNSNTVNQAAGTYSAEDLLEEYSFLISGNDTTAIYFVAGSITLTEAADGSVTIAGQLKGDNNITYDILLVYDETTTGIDNSAVDVKAVKVIREGMLFIEKAGVKYNVIGQKIR